MTINAKPHPLREYRVRESLTQDHLARLLGVSKAAVSRWENGERKPDQQACRNIAKKIGISAEELRPDLVEFLGAPCE